jgi:hypothetical protein
VAGLICGVVVSQPIVPTKIDDNYAWFNKAGTEFLLTLPDWPGPR